MLPVASEVHLLYLFPTSKPLEENLLNNGYVQRFPPNRFPFPSSIVKILVHQSLVGIGSLIFDGSTSMLALLVAKSTKVPLAGSFPIYSLSNGREA